MEKDISEIIRTSQALSQDQKKVLGSPNVLEFLRKPENRGTCRSLVSSLAIHQAYPEVARLAIAKFTENIGALNSNTKDHGPSYGNISDLSRAWASKYIRSGALEIFKRVLQVSQQHFDSTQEYSKILPILQSSGTGKSRMVDELSKEIPAIIYTFRRNGSTGFPPADPEIMGFVDETISYPAATHAASLALLSASINEMKKQVACFKESGIDWPFARWHHSRMAPIVVTETTPSATLRSLRSDHRKAFCEAVRDDAREIRDSLKRGDWEHIFAVNSESGFSDWGQLYKYKEVQAFATSIGELVEELKSLDGESVGPDVKLFFGLDEVSSLTLGASPFYPAIRRLLRAANDHPMWTLTLSTKPPVGEIATPASEDPSARVVQKDLIRVNPFYMFPFGVVAKDAMISNRAWELQKSLRDCTLMEHAIQFGRPLWASYPSSSASGLKEFARTKLLLNKGIFNAESAEHVFSALSARVCLNVCVQNKGSVKMVKSTVDSHLRIITAMDSNYGIMESIFPAEPVLAQAISEILIDRKKYPQGRWLFTLSNRLLEEGLLDRGDSGELVARIICMLARDLTISKQQPVDGDFGPIFTAGAFFANLFSDSVHAKFDELLTAKQKTALNGYMNFTQFASTSRDIERNTTRSLLLGLLREHTALQLRNDGQKYWDLLLPIYMGSADEPINLESITAIIIQVKNQKKAVSFSDKGFDLEWNTNGLPLIIFQMELGRAPGGPRQFKGLVEVSKETRSTNTDTTALFRVIGRDHQHYACLDPGATPYIEQILNLPMGGPDIQAKNIHLVDPYCNHALEDRYPSDNSKIFVW